MSRIELQKQIQDYNLSGKLKQLADKDAQRRPFRHLPKQFSKGILIGNIAIVPRKSTETRYVYVIADMLEAKILYDDVNLKQTAIMIAHHLAENNNVPADILDADVRFASAVFDIINAKRHYRMAEKEKDDGQMFVYENKFVIANEKADNCKMEIQQKFNNLFS